MEEKILDDEEAELYGFKRKILPADNGTNGENPPPMPENDGETEEIELSAELDEGYTADGYARPVELLPPEPSDAAEDDESLVMLSPEEAAALVKKREERARKEKELFEKLLSQGVVALERGDFEKARECFTQANELNSDDIELNIGYMRAYSEDFTALDDLETMEEVYAQCYESAGEAFASRIKEQFSDRLQAAKAEAEREEKEKNAAYTAEYQERKAEYTARANKANGRLIKLVTPLLLFAVAAAICACFVNAIEGNLFVILLAVCGGLAVILLVPTLFAAKKSADIAHLLHDNERLDFTQEGRDLQRLRDKIEFIDGCLQ